MAEHPAFITMTRALGALRRGNRPEALALAEAAFRMTEEIPGAPSRAAVVASWYGYLRSSVAGETERGLQICREAAEKVFWEPRIYDHLARTELAVGSRENALAAVRSGLRLAPKDAELLSIRRWLGVRRRPLVKFLDRAHPINRLAGRVRARATPPPRPKLELSPTTLG